MMMAVSAVAMLKTRIRVMVLLLQLAGSLE